MIASIKLRHSNVRTYGIIPANKTEQCIQTLCLSSVALMNSGLVEPCIGKVFELSIKLVPIKCQMFHIIISKINLYTINKTQHTIKRFKQ